MSIDSVETAPLLRLIRELPEAGRDEVARLDILSTRGDVLRAPLRTARGIDKRPAHSSPVMIEAYIGERPGSFSRGIRLDFDDKTTLRLSGTAGADEAGLTKHRMIFEPRFGGRIEISGLFSTRKVPRGMTSCVPFVRSERHRMGLSGFGRMGLTGFRPAPAFGRGYAVKICSSRSRPWRSSAAALALDTLRSFTEDLP